MIQVLIQEYDITNHKNYDITLENLLLAAFLK